MEFLPIKRALLSVTEKGGLVDFAAFLAGNGVELVSTGGTAKAIREAGLTVTPVEEVTGFPEILGGRVKTLHPKIHGGILADKDNPDHLKTLGEHDIQPFDLICVNLYNFAEAARKKLEFKAAVEEIDIGGPCMIRAAAKNFHSVLVVPNPSWYPRVREAMEQTPGGIPLQLRREAAAAAFSTVSAYDAMIAAYLAG